MSLRTATKSALKYVDVISPREFRVAVLVCTAVAALNALAVSYSTGYGDGRVAGAYPCYVALPRDIFHDLMRIKIELALVVIAVVLRFRRVVGLCISAVATLFIVLQYALWYLDTQRWLREMHVSNFSQLPVPGEWPNFAGLSRATPWDFVIFVFTTVLFVWQIRVLIALMTNARLKNAERPSVRRYSS